VNPHLPTGEDLARDFHDLSKLHREQMRKRIQADNFEPVDGIRAMKVLQAREAIAAGAYDAPAILDNSLDLMLAHSDLDQHYDERAAERDLLDGFVSDVIDGTGSHRTEIDYSDCGFIKDFEP
jgi:hypothetical protein